MDLITENFPEIEYSDKIDYFHWFPEKNRRGCLALADILEGTVIATIPLNCCLFARTESQDPSMALASLIKETLRNDSNTHKFYNYIYRLWGQRNSELSLIPVMWPEEERLQFLGNSLTFDIYNNCIRKFFEFPGFIETDELSQFSIALMLSRAFAHSVVDIAMVPLADQFNHSCTEWSTRIRDVGEDGIILYAERSICMGEEVYSVYGNFNYQWTFLTHGFLEPGNLKSFLVPFRFLGLPDDEILEIEFQGNQEISMSGLDGVFKANEVFLGMNSGNQENSRKMVICCQLRELENISIGLARNTD